MHILVLPSWYPTKEDPVKGSFFAEQAAALARFGHTVTVMAVYNDGMSGVQTEKCTDGNLTEYLIHVKPLRFHLTYFRILREMLRILRESGRPDIIHVHSFRAIRYARALKRRLHVPFVVTEHVTWFERNMLSEKELAAVSRDYNAADAVIAVGEGLKNAIQPLYRKAVQVIPNLADRRFFENGRHAPPQNGRFRFISVCLLDHKKGMDVLLAAVVGDAGIRVGDEPGQPYPCREAGDGMVDDDHDAAHVAGRPEAEPHEREPQVHEAAPEDQQAGTAPLAVHFVNPKQHYQQAGDENSHL